MTTDCNRRSGGSDPDSGSTAERTLAPGFSLVDANGNSVRLSDYRGKVVLLNFWATWCGPCRVEIPWFIEFEKSYHKRGFASIGISMDEQGWPAILPYIKREGVNYRVLLGNQDVVQRYGVERPPATFLIDRRGRLASAHVGLFNKEGYEEEIRRFIGSSA